MAMRKLWCLLLILFCLSTATIGIASATTQSLTIEAGKNFTYKINLNSQDKLDLTIVTVAQASSNLSFSIVFPDSTVKNLGNVDKYSTSFTTNVDGTFELDFDNTHSSDNVIVALNYNVTHYIFGVPTTIFMLIIIVVLVMAVVTGYVIMGKYS
jgi:hypothetical protein